MYNRSWKKNSFCYFNLFPHWSRTVENKCWLEQRILIFKSKERTWRNFCRGKKLVVAPKFLKNKPKIISTTIGFLKMYQNNLVLVKVFFRSLFCSTVSKNITFSCKVPQETYTVWTEKSDQLCCTKNSGYWTKELSNISTLTQLLKTFLFLFWISVICFKTTFLKLFYLCICITETNAFRYELKTNVEINMLVVYLNSFPNILISDF